MDDLIRRQAAIDEVNRLAKFFWEKWHEYAPSTIAVTDAIKAIPSARSADAVEVVRCKDCKYFELNHWDGPIITAHEICSKWADGCKTNKDGYCFLGERKTDV